VNIRFLYFLIPALLIMSCEEDIQEQAEHKPEITKKPVKPKPEFKNGFQTDQYSFSKDTIQNGDSFGSIMYANGVSRGKIFETVNAVKDTFNLRRIRAGNPYTLIKKQDSAQTVEGFIYNNDRINYTVIKFGDTISASRKKKAVSIRHRTASGVIGSSLSTAMDREGLTVGLIRELANLYQWKIDFFRLQKGDQFKISYNEKYISDTIYAGLDDIDAALFKHAGDDYYAFQFGKDTTGTFDKYYNSQGESLQSFFLKAPLNFTRISSRYQRRRFHPVQRRWKAHKGTDYAAPTGTPIWTTADGTVIRSGYTSGNGNYVKVRHNGKYTTQYLHMTKRNARRGDHVKQGDIIGYVGSTGLATGPHVCYRFWVHGRQVDPFKQDLPSSEPLPNSLKPEYFEHIKPLKKELDSLPSKKLDGIQ